MKRWSNLCAMVILFSFCSGTYAKKKALDAAACDAKTKAFDEMVEKAREDIRNAYPNYAEWKIEQAVREAKQKLGKSFFEGLLAKKKYQEGLDLLTCDKFMGTFSGDDYAYIDQKFRSAQLVSRTAPVGRDDVEGKILNLQAEISKLNFEILHLQEQISKINSKLNINN